MHEAPLRLFTSLGHDFVRGHGVLPFDTAEVHRNSPTRSSSRAKSRASTGVDSRPGSRASKARGISEEYDRYASVITPERSASPVSMFPERPRFPFSALRRQPAQVAAVPAFDPAILREAKTAIEGRKSYVTAKRGQTLYDEWGDREGRYNPSRELDIVRIKIADLQGASRKTEPSRINSILKAIAEGVPLTPIRVNSRNEVANGFHRVAASRLLGLQYIYVEKHRAEGW